MADIIPLERIEGRILLVRGRKALLDSDLADLYGVPTKRLNEQIKRNIGRFPDDFMFQLDGEEVAILKSQFATSSWGGRRANDFKSHPYAHPGARSELNSHKDQDLTVEDDYEWSQVCCFGYWRGLHRHPAGKMFEKIGGV